MCGVNKVQIREYMCKQRVTRATSLFPPYDARPLPSFGPSFATLTLLSQKRAQGESDAPFCAPRERYAPFPPLLPPFTRERACERGTGRDKPPPIPPPSPTPLTREPRVGKPARPGPPSPS